MSLQVPFPPHEPIMAWYPWFCYWCTGLHLLGWQWCCDIYILDHQITSDTIQSLGCQSRILRLSHDGNHVSTYGYQLLL